MEEVEEVVEEMVGAIKDTGSEFLHAIEEAVGAREALFELRKNSTGRAKFEFDLEEYCNTIDLDFNIVQELTYVYNGYQFCMNPSSGGVLENIIYLDGHNDQPEPNNDSGKDDHCSLKINLFRILNHLEIITCYFINDNNLVIRWRSNPKFCEPVSRTILFCEAWWRYERKYRESKLQFAADNTRARTFNAISSFLSATHRKVASSILK